MSNTAYTKKSLLNNFSPMESLGQKFIWKATYDDGSIIYEFEQDGKENQYNDLDKNKINKFAIIGNGGEIWFSMSDGIIHLDGGRDLTISLEIDNKTYDITNLSKENYKSIEQYKKGECFFSTNEKVSKMTPYEHYIGYSGERFLLGKDILYFTVVFGLDTHGNPYTLKICLTCTNTYNGEAKLNVKYGGNSIQINNIELKRNKYIENKVIL